MRLLHFVRNDHLFNVNLFKPFTIIAVKVDKERIKKYAFEKGVRFIVLFGSQAVGNRGENSDFDVAVLTTKGKNISILENTGLLRRPALAELLAMTKTGLFTKPSELGTQKIRKTSGCRNAVYNVWKEKVLGEEPYNL